MSLFLLELFIGLKLLEELVQLTLARLNRGSYRNAELQKKAMETLKLSSEEMGKTLAYTEAKYTFGLYSSLINLGGFLLFLVLGGFGYLETTSKAIMVALEISPDSQIWEGLFFFGCLMLLSGIFSLPFELYSTFVIEEKFGFNRQTKAGFIKDKVKGVLIGVPLGGLLLGGILWVMGHMGVSWWLWAFVLSFGFSLFLMWIYPTLLAPLFNKFTPLPEGELATSIADLSKKVGFKLGRVLTMDASIRSTHGNAYFTGVFGAKTIVLFDTLVKTLSAKEVLAVLGHELGHFKLHHVRMSLVLAAIKAALMFYAFSLAMPHENFYTAFGLSGVSNYGALLVFSSWFGLITFYLTPVFAMISRRNEFAADSFAREHLKGSEDLVTALMKLSESNHSMPISHPWYSFFYYSHPPLLERIQALRAIQ